MTINGCRLAEANEASLEDMCPCNLKSKSKVLPWSLWVVLAHRFFIPYGFSQNDQILSSEEAEAAEIEIIAPELAIFKTDWFRLQVTADRFQLTTPKVDTYEALRDLAISTFTILHHTPIRQVGINRDFHTGMGDEEKRNQLGEMLAPPSPWEKALHTPKLLALVMKGEREDDRQGHVHVKVEPSALVNWGVHLNINDHFDLDKKSSGAQDAVALIADVWQESAKRATTITTSIFKQA